MPSRQVKKKSCGVSAPRSEPTSLPTDLDLSELLLAQHALSQSQARLRAVLETAVDAIITIDHRGIMQSVNGATARMFGYRVAEMTGRTVNMLMPSPYRKEHDGYLARYLSTGQKRIIGIGREVQGRRKDGTVFPIDLAVSEVEPGKLFTGIIRDISDRKISESKLREADRLASIGALAAGLGHDMNNVLLPVKAHLNALKEDDGGISDRRKHVDRIHKGIAYLQQLADGLHYLAMDPDQIDVSRATTDLHSWWAQTGALLGKAVPKHVRVRAKFPANLPNVAIAPHALTQAVLNLVVNAGEAIPTPRERKRRQGYVQLSAKSVRDGSSVGLTVADNGSGMTEEVKRRAFDMFFTTKSRGLGTGLGLAMVQKVVDRTGGSVVIDTALEKGTSITLVLPTSDDRRPTISAAVRIRDGRVASVIRTLAEISGVDLAPHDDPSLADIWIIEPQEDDLGPAREWHRAAPNRRLILVGRPERGRAAEWGLLNPLIIDDPKELDSVRASIGRAMTHR